MNKAVTRHQYFDAQMGRTYNMGGITTPRSDATLKAILSGQR
jgi:hypothetical protein